MGITFNAWKRLVLESIEPFNQDKFRLQIAPLGDGSVFGERVSMLFDSSVFSGFIEEFMSGDNSGNQYPKTHEFYAKFDEFIDRLAYRKFSIEKIADDPEWLEIAALSNDAMAEIEALQDPKPEKEYT